MTIVITGGTGLIGQALAKKLFSCNYKIHILSRSPQKESPFGACFLWPQKKEAFSIKAFPQDEDYGVVHLAGESVASWPWSKKKKEKIYSSRVEGTKKLFSFLESLNRPPSFFISASAVGVYGEQNKDCDEASSTPKSDFFLQKLCLDWEQEALKFNKLCRTIILRLGIVLSPRHAFLGEHEKWIKKGLFPSSFSFKDHWMSWISIEDVVSLILWVAQNQQAKGIYNAVSPQPARLNTFYNVFRKQKAKDSFFIPLPLPLLLLKILGGEAVKNLLMSSKIFPNKALSEGFTFQKADLNKALSP